MQMQHTMPPRTEDSIGPSAAQYQTTDPGQYRGDPKAGQSLRRLLDPRITFIGVGVVLLTMLCIVPIWNAGALMSNDNYVYWVGRETPAWIVALSLGLVVLYVTTVFVFFGCTSPTVHSEQTIMMIANIFITLLGMLLILASLPLTRQSVETYTTLMHSCSTAESTHRLYEYSQVLQNIRATPECAAKYSVEECSGYEEAEPYTGFLKTLETRFRCAGFCYQEPRTAAAAGAAGAAGNTTGVPATAPAARVPASSAFRLFGPAPGNSFCGGNYLLSTGVQTLLECQAKCTDDEKCRYFSYWATGKSHWCHTTAACETLEKDTDQVIWIYARQGQQEEEAASKRLDFAQEAENATAFGHQLLSRRPRTNSRMPVSILQVEDGDMQPPAAAEPLKTSAYPPTLFSDANYQASCEGMAARDMKNFAGDIGSQTFYQGVYLVLIAITTGFLKLVGFCVRKEHIEKAVRG